MRNIPCRHLVLILGDQLDETSSALEGFDRVQDVVLMVEAFEEGVRRKSWTGLRCKSEALSVFKGTEGAKRDFDALFVVPADVGVNYSNELFKGCSLPVP